MGEQDIGFLEYLWNNISSMSLPYILFSILGISLGIFGICTYKKNQKAITLISVYLLFTSAWEIVNFASVYYYRTNRLTFKIYDLVEVVIFSIVLSLLISKSYTTYIKNQSFVVIVIGIILGALIVGLHGAGDYGAIVFDAHIISLCAIYFYKILDQLYEQKLEITPSFWIVSGILIYQSTAFLVQGTMSLMVENTDLAALWVLSHVSRLLMYLFFVYAFYLTTKEWTQSRSVS